MSNAKPDDRYQNMLQSMVLISTGHLTARTAQFLRDHDAADWPSPGGHFGDMGWFFWIDEGAGGSLPHLPHDLISAFEYAAGLGVAFILFQDVSPVVPQLPTYRKSRMFEADVFLNRTKKTIDELDDAAAIAAQESLSLDIGFIATAAHIAARMQAVIDDIAAHASNGQISALPYHSLQQLSDLATIHHFHAKRKDKGFDSGASVTEGLAARIDLILVDRDLGGLARHGRTREVLENVQYRLRLSIKISAS